MRLRHLVVLLLVALTLPTSASAYQRPGSTVQATVSSEGVPGDGDPDACSSSIACDAYVDMTPNGRFVAFNSAFTDLVPGDTNEMMDVFVRDQWLGTTERVSVAWDGSESVGTSGGPSISDDGRLVTFTSNATNLVPGGTTGEQIFARDRVAQTTFVVSVSDSGAVGTGTSGNAEISGDGRHVAFWSSSFDDPYLFLNTRGGQVYVRDLLLGTTERVAKTDTGEETEGVETYRSDVAINGDGRFVAWEARHHNVTPGDVNGNVDIFVRDRVLGTTERISVNDAGEGANWASYAPSLSADGRYVAFNSFGSNLVPADGNGRTTAVFGGGIGGDVFVRDRALGTTRRVNVSSDGAEDDRGGSFAALSGDGRFVAFTSEATTLVPGSGGVRRIFRHDLHTGETAVASIPMPGGHTRTAFVGAPALSADGSMIAFAGDSANTPFENAVYVTTLGAARHLRATARDGGAGIRVTGTVGVSGAEVAAASDPLGDVHGAYGADLIGARVVARPEAEDVLIEITPSILPSTTNETPGSNYLHPGRPEVTVATYVASFVADGARYEVRAGLDPASGMPGAGARFSLHRCDAACEIVRPLSGSWGGRGTLVAISIPTAALAPQVLSDLRVAATALGVTDEIALGDVHVERPVLQIGVTHAGAETLTEVPLVAGGFDATVAGSAPDEVRARLCLSWCDSWDLPLE